MVSARFTQGLLVVIAFLLACMVIRPYMPSAGAQAATAPVVQYKIAQIEGGLGPGNMEPQLNELGKDGWTLVTCPNGFGYCIFKK